MSITTSIKTGIKTKQKMYKTAFSKMFQCYVIITHAYQDSNGEWIFEGQNSKEGLKCHLFRTHELTQFCL